MNNIKVNSKVKVRQSTGEYKEGIVTFVLRNTTGKLKGIVRYNDGILKIVNNLNSKYVEKIKNNKNSLDLSNTKIDNKKKIDQYTKRKYNELKCNRTYYISNKWMVRSNREPIIYIKLGKFKKPEKDNYNNKNIYLKFEDEENNTKCLKQIKINNYEERTNIFFYEEPNTESNKDCNTESNTIIKQKYRTVYLFSI